MAEDWGISAELQLMDLRGKKLSCFSRQTGLKFRGVSRERSNPNVSNLKEQPYSEVAVDTDRKDDEEEPDLTVAQMSLMKEVLRARLIKNTSDVDIQTKEGYSPLYSVKSFDELQIPSNLLKGIYAMGFNAPSKIQETSLPTLLANPPVNMIAQSQNGTGKTAAFLLASIARINVDEDYPQVLILLPTYELALQIGEVAREMARFCDKLSCRFAVKGERAVRGETITEHIVVGTPGKVIDWVKRYNYFDITKIRVFVLDEADVMISQQGHQDQCIRVHKMLSENCQMLLFSATYTQEVIDFAEQIVPNPIVIRVRREEEALDNVHQYFIRCASPDLKYMALRNIYGAISVGQTIIFCRYKRSACWLGQKLTEDGHIVGYLSSDLNENERFSVMTSFREGQEKVLITTNVLARGIDIEQVTMVVNFDLPVTRQGDADCETYLHRIGRTGRFGKSGTAVNLVSSEQDEKVLRTIEEHFGKPIIRINADSSDDLESMND